MPSATVGPEKARRRSARISIRSARPQRYGRVCRAFQRRCGASACAQITGRHASGAGMRTGRAVARRVKLGVTVRSPAAVSARRGSPRCSRRNCCCTTVRAAALRRLLPRLATASSSTSPASQAAGLDQDRTRSAQRCTARAIGGTMARRAHSRTAAARSLRASARLPTDSSRSEPRWPSASATASSGPSSDRQE